MSNEAMMVFQNDEFGSVRTFIQNGEPWFSAVDVCTSLGIRNSRMAVDRLDDDEKGVSLTDTLGGPQKMTIVSEPGLYTLILSSRKPSAKAFKRWITHEVIPSIRKHGAYVTDSVLDQLEENPDFIPDYIQRLRDENARAKQLRQELATMQGQLAEVQPLADYYNTYIDNRDALCFRYVAKELEVSERKLIQYLLDRKILYRDPHRHNHVFPCSGDYQHLFIVRDFHTKWGHRGQYTLVTPEGRSYLLKRKEKIANHQPKNTSNDADEICPAQVAGGSGCCTLPKN